MKRSTGRLAVYVVLIVGAATMLLPFLWMISTSLKTETEATRVPITLLPEQPMLDNYREAFSLLPFEALYLNTFLLIAGRVLLALSFASMSGYAFARIPFRGRSALFSIVLIQMIIPSQVFTIPQYLMVAGLGWLNTTMGLIFPGIVTAFGTFLMRQFFLSLPTDIEEAAIIDGCNRWQIYARIMLPLSVAGLVALGIFTALFAYKELLWPLIVNSDVNKMTLSAGLASLQGRYETNYTEVMAGSVIAMLPMVILFLVFQKRFVRGIAFTGSKG